MVISRRISGCHLVVSLIQVTTSAPSGHFGDPYQTPGVEGTELAVEGKELAVEGDERNRRWISLQPPSKHGYIMVLEQGARRKKGKNIKE